MNGWMRAREWSRERARIEEQVRAEEYEKRRAAADAAYVEGVTDALENVEVLVRRYNAAVPRHVLLGAIAAWKDKKDRT